MALLLIFKVKICGLKELLLMILHIMANDQSSDMLYICEFIDKPHLFNYLFIYFFFMRINM